MYQAGTLSGNPLATAAGLAVLEAVGDGDYKALADRAARFAAGLTEAVGGAGLPVQVPVIGPLVGLFFTAQPVTDYETARASVANGLYARFFGAMLAQRGGPGPRSLRDDVPRPGSQ